MTYLVTARKWRPMVFEDVVGQSHVTTTLRNAIATHRISHAYIFSGMRGVGKTTAARILAKAVNCLNPKDFNPDNACELCQEITEGRSVNVFEIDGASNRGVDEIRNLREAVRYGPAKGKYKVYIIDEVHMLTKEAFNALLKTLEEPPSYVIFIFATTEIHKVPLTILSRCQRFDFRRITIDEIIDRLRFIAEQEHISIDDDALFHIAKRADGSLRDAQSLFDQVVSFCGENITSKQIIEMLNIVDEEIYFKVTGVIKAKDAKGALLLVDEIISRGFDLREFISGFIEHLRNLLLTAATGSTLLIETSEHYKKRYQEEAKAFSEQDLLHLITIACETDSSMRWNLQARLKLEVGLLRMIKMDSSVRIDQLLDQLEELKKKLSEKRGDEPSSFFSKSQQVMTETPIHGTVKASPPLLRTDQVVAQLGGTVLEPSITYQSTMPPTVTMQSSANQPLPTFSYHEAMEKWSALIQEARTHRIALGTMLNESKLIEVRDDRLYIGCPDDFHLDALKRNRQFLSELAEKIYGARVRLEAMLSGEQSSPSKSDQPRAIDTSDKQDSHNELLQHPVVQALIQKFGAQPVE
ncbi:MAG: DNA polymerase III subunit gamma/tau [Ignavibacteriae bacterium]|nr:DNA polymerase III subunit gamma/tau [Ignavibacteriota bacterium]